MKKHIKQRIAYSISNTAVFCALFGVFSALGNMELGNCCTVKGMIIALFSMAVFIISACLSNAISECMEREKRTAIDMRKPGQ